MYCYLIDNSFPFQSIVLLNEIQCIAMKKPYTVRLDGSLLDQIQSKADKEGETVTSIFEQALKSFLSAPNDKPDIGDLLKRVERLEATLTHTTPKKKQRSASTKGKTPQPIKDPELLGKLITLEEAVTLTGYTKSTLVSKFSKADITAVSRVDGNRKGLYSKSEVVEKIGYNS